MTLTNVHKVLKPDYLMLLLIMTLAFYIAYIPQLNYPYPLHVDEWLHIAYANTTLQADNITGLGSNLEAGFHLFWGVFHEISSISWITIARYFPGIVFIITVLSVYILAHREGFETYSPLVNFAR